MNRYVEKSAKITLNTKAPATPHNIICFLCFGIILAAMSPIIIALSAAKTISMNIICNSIISSYWDAIGDIYPEALGDPQKYVVQKGTNLIDETYKKIF